MAEETGPSRTRGGEDQAWRHDPSAYARANNGLGDAQPETIGSHLVPRRIEIELTSAREDGTYTWRAAGAKLPKGVVSGALLYAGAKTGDVIRAEAEQGLDGIDITSVIAPASARVEAPRVEVVGSGRSGTDGVVTNLAPKRGGRDSRDGDRRPPRDDERRPPRDDDRRGPRAGGDRPPGDRPAGGRPGGDRPAFDRGPRPGGRDGARPAPRDGADRGGRPVRAPAVKANVGSVHRNAAVDALEGGDQAIAIEWLKGGIQAVRKAAGEQNEANKSEGKPEVKAELLVSRAEHLIPALREAKWHDEAEATKAIVDEVALRDLRSIVTAADGAARSEDTRTLASELRADLERRVGVQREAWTTEISAALEEGRIVRALNLSARAPDPTTKVPAELSDKLAAAASAAMNPDAKPGTWSQLLTAVLDSPVRRSVKPVGLPTEPGPALLSEAKQAAGRVPALGKMLGVAIPPPPGSRPKPPAPDGPVADAATAHAPDAPAPADEAPVTAAVPAEAPNAEPAVHESPVAEVPVAEAPVAEAAVVPAPVAEPDGGVPAREGATG